MGAIVLKGCRQNNLKGFDLTIPKGQLIALVGVSGCGKSSLAFGTLYAEAQRRFLECLSPHIRQSIRLMPRPAVDYVEGLCPCLALGQGTGRIGPSITIGQHTDLDDLFGVLFASCGQSYSPTSGLPLAATPRPLMVERLMKEIPKEARFTILSPLPPKGEPLEERLARLQSLGFIRVRLGGTELLLDEELPKSLSATAPLEVVIDRLVQRPGIEERLLNSIQTALNLSRGIVKVIWDEETLVLTEDWIDPATGERFPTLTGRHFSSSGRGACSSCQGSGGRLDAEATEPWQPCATCHGTGLQAYSLAIRWRSLTWALLQEKTLGELLAILETPPPHPLPDAQQRLERELLPELRHRLRLLTQLGLGYMALGRRGCSLSEGEDHRVQLAAHIGAKLSGVLYILDEPTAGLHPEDILLLGETVQALVTLENTVLILDHDRHLLQLADQIIELGPAAGPQGGEITFQGSVEACKASDCLTGQWLRGALGRTPSRLRPVSRSTIELTGLKRHNLKDLTIQFPLERLVVVCGVSGSGKSTLVLECLAPRVQQKIDGEGTSSQMKVTGKGFPERLVQVVVEEAVRHPRSLVATYLDLMTPMRQLFAQTRLARARGYTATRFGLHRPGGRCEACEGLGVRRISLELLPDLYLTCDTCQGRRYNEDTLQCLWHERSIADVLATTVEAALKEFNDLPQLKRMLEPMLELGLGYLVLGQPLPSLSYGELQRVRLAKELSTSHPMRTLYLLDEPSSGLHPAELALLIQALQRLVDLGHSVVIIDHHLDVVRQADHCLELGPVGGPEGGHLLFDGSPETLARMDTPTGHALRSTS
ncbi:MAG: ATP-binding cassette domain-containing protein [Chlamydiia bacterium]